MQFGVTFVPDPPCSRFVELVQLAEANGFDHAWTYDSHVLFPDAYPFLTVAATQTSTIRLGHCVTNPGTREPTVTASLYATLQGISGGRMALGIGRGDSAQRVLGKAPVKLREFEEALQMIRRLMNGEPHTWQGVDLEMTWAQNQPRIPLFVAGYGPRALASAGRAGDGVIIALADPELLEWMMGHARDAAREEGRDPDELELIACAPAYIGNDRQVARDQVRWFPPMVTNHVADMVTHHDPDSLPESLTQLVRRREQFDHDYEDYSKHSRVDDPHANFVDDDTCDRFCFLGTPEEHVEKIRALEQLGVTQCNVYVMAGNQEEIIKTYGQQVIPAFRSRTGVAGAAKEAQ